MVLPLFKFTTYCLNADVVKVGNAKVSWNRLEMLRTSSQQPYGADSEYVEADWVTWNSPNDFHREDKEGLVFTCVNLNIHMYYWHSRSLAPVVHSLDHKDIFQGGECNHWCCWGFPTHDAHRKQADFSSVLLLFLNSLQLVHPCLACPVQPSLHPRHGPRIISRPWSSWWSWREMIEHFWQSSKDWGDWGNAGVFRKG